MDFIFNEYTPNYSFDDESRILVANLRCMRRVKIRRLMTRDGKVTWLIFSPEKRSIELILFFSRNESVAY